MATKPEWKTAELDPRKILLDVRNPRIEVEEDATEEEILLKLLDFEDVLELARNIEKNGGVFKGERIITVIENGKHVVLEGNRRVAASKMLLDPKLVPTAYKMRFPVASSATKTALRKLSSDVSPDRETAEPILTKRHTERGVKPWAPVAKMRRAVRLLEHMSVDQVAQMLGTSPSQVKKLVRPYRLLKYAINLKGWNEHERKALEDEKLKTNPYTRFFTLSKTKEALQYHFDDDENIISALPQKTFKEQMTRIARDFLIPDPATGRTRCDTRTSPDEYFSAFLKSPEGKPPQDNTPGKGDTAGPGQGGKNPPGDKTNTGEKPSPGNTKPATPRASVFFENLQCHVQDDNLIKLTEEIRRVDHVRTTISASLLTRALFECSLVYKIKAAKKWGELIKADGKDPGLAELIKFSSNFANGVFTENNICKALRSHTTVQAKNYLDAMTHLKYQNADAPTLQSVANNLRQVIQYILAGN